MRGASLVALTVALAPALAECDAPRDPPRAAAAAPAADSVVPATKPQIRGTITLMLSGQMRVEAKPDERAGSPKAVVRVASSVPVAYRDGRRAAVAQLRLGQRVSVWFAGPAEPSYPERATASVIVIDADGPAH